jgi:FtsP/CotA-like multicopper oxidase with cupredoxin domain
MQPICRWSEEAQPLPCSGKEERKMAQLSVTKMRRAARVEQLLAPAGLLLAALLLPQAADAGTVSEMCASGGPSFSLETAAGHIDTPDGNSVFMWGYAIDPGAAAGDFQIPGPILCVHQGDTVTINLTNTLPEPVSIVFPGQSGVIASGGTPGLFTNEAPASGGTVSYSFVAAEPGTYLYESGTNPHKQVEMGLYGAIIVRPTMGDDYAYNDAATQFDPDQEYLILIHDIDPALHQVVEEQIETPGATFNGTLRHDAYWTINGRSFPDTIDDDGVHWLPNQPYGSLVKVRAVSCATPGAGEGCEPAAGLPALIRYANAGLKNHPFHPHGNHLRIIARDGRLLGGAGFPGAMEAFGKTVGSGETYDLLTRWVNEQEFSSASNPLPSDVTPPENQNLTFKDEVTFYSGSPYLGEQDDLPPPVVRLNQCGEFYFPWHSHALNEFENFDEGFGGLATLWRVEPPLPNTCP